MLRNETGFTLVELLVATAIAGVMISAISGMFLVVGRSQAQANRLLLASQAAENQLETLRNEHFNSIPLDPDIDFSDELPGELLAPRSGTVAVSETEPGLKRLDVVVAWREGDGEREVKFSTLIGNTGIAQ